MMDMYEEYGYPKELYGGMAPHRGQDTSIEAAQKITPHANTIRARILNFIDKAGDEGHTCEETEIALNLYRSTVSTRIRELFLLGQIKHNGTYRLTTRGCKARVHVSI